MPINHYDPIADLYDIYVPTTFDIPFFIAETRQAGGEVLELMSGTGRVSIPLIEAGVRLTCVDLSAELNAILTSKLQQRGLQAEVHQMDVRSLELGRSFEMVIIPFHSFAHLTTPDDQRQALAHISRHLRPGGTFICTLTNPNLRGQAVDGQLRLFRKYPLPDERGTLLLWIVENHHRDDDRVVEAVQFYEEYDPAGVLTSKRMLELHFRLSTREEFEGLAQAAGFRVRAFYGDYDHSAYRADSPFMIWVLEKMEP